jgi:toxin ParE1/3/4
MKRRKVLFAPEAVEDLRCLYDYISERAGRDLAIRYVERLETYCLSFDLASERGTMRDDIRAGLRITSFEGRVTIAFRVTEMEVIFLRLFYAGAHWEKFLHE